MSVTSAAIVGTVHSDLMRLRISLSAGEQGCGTLSGFLRFWESWFLQLLESLPSASIVAAPVPSWIMHTASALAVVLFLFSLVSLVTKWDDTQSDAIQAAQKNYTLQTRWEELAIAAEEALENRFQSLSDEDAKQSESDVKQHVTDRAKRIGMHAALFKYQRQCAGCDRQPKSIAANWSLPFSSRCGVCGEPIAKVKK